MTTLTQQMIERIEFLKAAYADLIAADPDGSGFEYGQWCRLNTMLSYLEERAAR